MILHLKCTGGENFVLQFEELFLKVQRLSCFVLCGIGRRDPLAGGRLTKIKVFQICGKFISVVLNVLAVRVKWIKIQPEFLYLLGA